MFKDKKLLHYIVPISLIVLCVVGVYTKKRYIYPQKKVTNIRIANPTPVFNDSDYLNKEEYDQAIIDLTAIVKLQDPKAALSRLSGLMDIDPKVMHSCHGLVHEIGHTAYTKYGFSKALNFQDDLCGSGYLHGVIEKYFKDSKDILITMKSVCNSSGNSNNCFHGVGHGIMYYNENNVPLSIKTCDTYNNLAAKISCSEGVFMENFNSEVIDHPSVYLKPTDPFYPCQDQTDLYKDSCYFYAPDYFLHLHPEKYDEAIDWCATAEKNFVLKCFNGLGSRIMKQNIGSPTFSERICMKAKEKNQIASCIDGMVSYYLVNYSHISRAKSMCTSLDVANKTTCNEAVNRRASLYPF